MKSNLIELAKNYEMGFISSMEFISAYMECLQTLGAEKELFNVANEVNAPLANFLVDILRGSGKSINQFGN